MSLPFYREFGWEPVVLCVHPDDVESSHDPLLEQTIPADIAVERVRALSPRLTRLVGAGSLGLRSLVPIHRAGCRLLREGNFDLVFFSTTVFPCMALGAPWEKRFGVPYIVDVQDPWQSDYYSRRGAPLPPGGRLKHAVARQVARLLEPRAFASPRHLIVVSDAYRESLRERYPHLRAVDFSTLPFAASRRDFEIAAGNQVRQDIFQPSSAVRNWLYVGAAGDVMRRALELLFSAVAEVRRRNPQLLADVRIHFAGTSYAPDKAGKNSVLPLAERFGLADMVQENSRRVPYLEALRAMQQCDLLLMPGTDDPGYKPSKLFGCILSGRAILGILREESPARHLLESLKAARVATFGAGEPSDQELQEAIGAVEWAAGLPRGYAADGAWDGLAHHGARESTRRQCEIFDACARPTIPT